MAFSYDGSNLPRFNNYAEALKFWENAKHWRGQDNERKLDGAKKHVTIRRLHDGSIACRLHNTDVVTIHPNNIATIRPYGSLSTDEFFNRLTPYGVCAYFNSGLIQRDGKYYKATKTFGLHMEDMSFVTETEPFKINTINRKRAAEIRKQYNYQEFAVWVKMLSAIGEYPRGTAGFWTPDTVVSLLRDRTHWPDLVAAKPTRTGRVIDVPSTLKRVREALYAAHPEVYDTDIRPYLRTYAEIRAWQKS